MKYFPTRALCFGLVGHQDQRSWWGVGFGMGLGVLIWLLGWSLAMPVNAQTSQTLSAAVLGVHVLNPQEITEAKTLVDIKPSDQQWHYLTIPLTLADLTKKAEWQEFFSQAKSQRMIPIVRLMTKFENGSWKVPTRRDVIELTEFLSALEWPTEQKFVIVFNEVNHANEWGGRIDPAEYAAILRFTANWLHTENQNFAVLPAAMDLAAPNGTQTREAFSYLTAMLAADSEVFSQIDFWNSHSYPNPGFSSAPTRVAVNSLRGFWFELEFLKKHTNRDFRVFITETGWADSSSTRRRLSDYYTYALKNIWSDPRVIAVTPFVLRGAPGPFAAFGFLDQNNQPTNQYRSLQQALQRIDQS
ncbi:MAG TPA: hypothetical protein DEP87_00575 [Candidatus Pacebacteria bacterium]|nr:hypothetical protein [Candidatus Paceibacterota bacterium]